MMKEGPWVIGAFFCMAVVLQDDQQSFLFQVGEVPVGRDEEPAFRFVCLIAGGEAGRFIDVRLESATPSGDVIDNSYRLELLGTHSTSYVIPAGLPFTPSEIGTYWVNVYFDDVFQVASPVAITRA